MALESDAYGFLVGAPVEWGRALGVFKEIRDEIQGLRRDLIAGGGAARGGSTRQRQPAPVVDPGPPSAPPKVAVPRARATSSAARDARGRFVSSVPAPAPRQRTATPTRGANGRFVSQAAGGGASASPAPMPATSRPTSITINREPPIDVAAVDAARAQNGPRANPELIAAQNAAMTHRKPSGPPRNQAAAAGGSSGGGGASGTTGGGGGAGSAPSPSAPGVRHTVQPRRAMRPISPATAERERRRLEREEYAYQKGIFREKKALARKKAQEEKAAQRARAKTVHGIDASIQHAPDVDPAVLALKEVYSVVRPIGRGMAFIFGKNDRPVPWYKKFLHELVGLRKDQSAYDKASLKALGNIGGGNGGSGGIFGALGGLFAKIPGVGLLGRALAAGGGLLAGAGGLIGKGLLRRLPLVGGLIAGGSALYSGLGFGDDPNASPEANRTNRFKGVGGGVGALAGGVIGSLAGPIGTVVGGVVGDKVGEKVGEWMSHVDIKAVARDAADAFARGKEAPDTRIKSQGALRAFENGQRQGETGIVNKAANLVGRGVEAISKVLSSGAGFNVTQSGDGTVTKRVGARNWRNNNPGNIEYGPFAKSMGAIGTDGRFAIFPTYEAGQKAREALIFNGKGYRNLTLSKAIERYAPKGENDVGAYQRAVLSSVGGLDETMSKYSPAQRAAILDAMQTHEGYKVGKVQTVSAPKTPSVSGPTVPSVGDVSAPNVVRLGAAKAPEFRVSVDAPEPGFDLPDPKIARIATGGLSSH